MPDPPRAAGRGEIVARRGELGSRLLQRQLAEQRAVTQRRFAAPCYPGWTSYASQRHIRAAAVDLPQERVWLATWGGVLCWTPAAQLCIRHTSEHGLLGNATCSLAVDGAGVVWAGGAEGGLCSLAPERTAWTAQADLRSWTVLLMVPRPAGGIYLALQHRDGPGALGAIAHPDGPLQLLIRRGLAGQEIQALLVDGEHLWIGNAWGLHLYAEDGPVITYPWSRWETPPPQVRALAPAPGGQIWAGTSAGLYWVPPDGAAPRQETGWPRQAVLSLVAEPETGHLWAATSAGIGRVVAHTWQPVAQSPPGRVNLLCAAGPPAAPADNARPLLAAGGIWAGGANGLFEVRPDQCVAALPLDAEDRLSNATGALWADAARLWAGTARGLACFRAGGGAGRWQTYDDAPELRDVRALTAGQEAHELWIGSARRGLYHVRTDWDVPVNVLAARIRALATGGGGVWAADADTLYWQPAGSRKWAALVPPAAAHIGAGIIQTLCYQVTSADGGPPVARLWVGTSAGLFAYRPDTGLWYPSDLGLPIQALAVDPGTNGLWIGTPQGLFDEDLALCAAGRDVRALAVGPAADRTLWMGTAAGLERWPAPLAGGRLEGVPVAVYTPSNSGLAAQGVTALAVRAIGQVHEVWIGSAAGVSCYRYAP